ncbi:MAG: NADH:flavin oxidoreductase [Candidatus Thermoplasmatota archaeon]
MTNKSIQYVDNPLQQPIYIGSLCIPNRLVRSATHENMADAGGIVTPEYQKLYEKLSQGGTGLLITGHFYVDKHGRTIQGMAGADDDQQIPPLRSVTEYVHQQKKCIIAQLNHAGLKASPEIGFQKRIVAPSKTYKAHALTSAEIDSIVEAFGKSARRLYSAGFDGIQLHAAHTFLIAQFLSKRINHRRDGYGGSLRNRQRFLLEVFSCVRNHLPASVPIIVKLDTRAASYASIPPLIPLISFSEALDTAKQLERQGCDALELSCGFFATRGAISYKTSFYAYYMRQQKPFHAKASAALLTPVDLIMNHTQWFKPHHNLKHISIFKQQVSIPILAGSCFRDPSVMKQVINNKQADMICFSRPLIHNPRFSQDILQGSTQSSGCLNCNLCLSMLPSGRPLRCYYGKLPKKSEFISRT